MQSFPIRHSSDDRCAAGDRRRSFSPERSGGRRRRCFLSSREEWRPSSFGRQGKKHRRRRCVQGDRGEAGPVARSGHQRRDGRRIKHREALCWRAESAHECRWLGQRCVCSPRVGADDGRRVRHASPVLQRTPGMHAVMKSRRAAQIHRSLRCLVRRTLSLSLGMRRRNAFIARCNRGRNGEWAHGRSAPQGRARPRGGDDDRAGVARISGRAADDRRAGCRSAWLCRRGCR